MNVLATIGCILGGAFLGGLAGMVIGGVIYGGADETTLTGMKIGTLIAVGALASGQLSKKNNDESPPATPTATPTETPPEFPHEVQTQNDVSPPPSRG